jgi:molybdopterin biosynthesis enzyme
VYPAIRRFMGFPSPGLRSGHFPLREAVKADPEKATFLKARIDLSSGRPEVVPLRHQGSHMISSLCQMNGILVVPPSDGVFEKGERGLVHALPTAWETGR